MLWASVATSATKHSGRHNSIEEFFFRLNVQFLSKNITCFCNNITRAITAAESILVFVVVRCCSLARSVCCNKTPTTTTTTDTSPQQQPTQRTLAPIHTHTHIRTSYIEDGEWKDINGRRCHSGCSGRRLCLLGSLRYVEIYIHIYSIYIRLLINTVPIHTHAHRFPLASASWTNCWTSQFRTNVLPEHPSPGAGSVPTIHCLAAAVQWGHTGS